MEEWRVIKGFDGYEVSSLGRVRSYWKRNGGPNRIRLDVPIVMTTSKSACGYKVFSLGRQKNGSKKQGKVARCLWEAFNGSIQKGYVVDHINRNRSDDRLENLRLATYSENICNSVSKRTGYLKGIRKKYYKDSVYYEVSVSKNSKRYYYNFSDEMSATLCRNVVTRFLHKEFVPQGLL